MNSHDPVSRRSWLAVASAASLTTGVAAAQSGGGAAPLGARVYNIVDFGAKGDGKTLDTQALQAAIDACAKDQGGTVLVPAGVFVIGTVEMKSNVTLHIAAQGKLLGSADGKQYHAADAIPLRGDFDAQRRQRRPDLRRQCRQRHHRRARGRSTARARNSAVPAAALRRPPAAAAPTVRTICSSIAARTSVIRDLYLVACAFHSIRVIQSSYVWIDGIPHPQPRQRQQRRLSFHQRRIRAHHQLRRAMPGRCLRAVRQLQVRDGDQQHLQHALVACSASAAEIRRTSPSPTASSIETYGCPIKMQFGPESQVQNILFSNLRLDRMSPGRFPSAWAIGPPRTPVPNATRATRVSAQHHVPGYSRRTWWPRAGSIADMAFPQNYRPGETRQCIVLNAIGDAVLENIAFNDVHVTYGGGGTAEEARRRSSASRGRIFRSRHAAGLRPVSPGTCAA